MGAPRGLVQRLDQEWHRSEVLPRGAGLLVAVRGGADSVSLLRLLVEINGSDYWGWKLVVGHVDHGVRGRASAADARFVRDLARELGVGFSQRKLKAGKGASEALLRDGRLKALRAMAKAAKCAGIVMAHHADDQAETVLMRMMRGCGVEGLAGMSAAAQVDGAAVYRPLLEVRGAALRGYLKRIGQIWREDETNASGRYTRNRVRGELLPLMESMYGGATEAIGRLSRLAGEVWEHVVAEEVELRLHAIESSGARREVFRREVLREADAVICAEVLRATLQRIGGTTETADFERVREAVRVVQGTHGAKRVELGRGGVVQVEGRRVVVERGGGG
jgi:tRNA(Ile)-lysidine synthetase-like protein